MQISRHWRLNAQRYRLEGVRDENGNVGLQARPVRDVESEEEMDARAVEPVLTLEAEAKASAA